MGEPDAAKLIILASPPQWGSPRAAGDGAPRPMCRLARIMRRDLSVEVLVPSRAEFERAFPDAVCDRAGIDDVLTFLVKGEVR